MIRPTLRVHTQFPAEDDDSTHMWVSRVSVWVEGCRNSAAYSASGLISASLSQGFSLHYFTAVHTVWCQIQTTSHYFMAWPSVIDTMDFKFWKWSGFFRAICESDMVQDKNSHSVYMHFWMEYFKFFNYESILINVTKFSDTFTYNCTLIEIQCWLFLCIVTFGLKMSKKKVTDFQVYSHNPATLLSICL